MRARASPKTGVKSRRKNGKDAKKIKKGDV